jgi:formylglycine-generating enzyme required for sulfatase activity
MKKTHMYVMITGCVLLALCIAVPSEGYRAINVIDDLKHSSEKIGAYRALIIGINNYKDPKIPDLETPLNDARSMADLLKKKYGFVVETIIDKEATRKSVYNALRNLSSTAKSNDSVLIYYAGHGDLDRQYNDGWWIPYDATAGDPTTYLDNIQVQKAMRSMNARHVLLISDSCYAGTLFGQTRSMPTVIDHKYYLNLYNEKSRWGMTSGNKTPVLDGGTGGHSVFAYQLLKELKNNDEPFISTQEIYTRIAPIVSNNSEQAPMCRPIRNTGDQGGEFIFIASSSAIVDMPATDVKAKTTFSVASNVTGAKVIVDGRPVGTTPLSDVDVSEGEHHILVVKKGYDSYQKKALFEAGMSTSMYVDLSKKVQFMGRLYVTSDPKSARVRLLNIGPEFYQGMDLEPGRYHVETSAKGYKTEKQWVALGAGEDKYLVIQLKQVPVVSLPYQGQKISNSLGMEFTYIQPGSFMMGSPVNESGRGRDEKQHRVTLTRDFYMQTTEVTQGQWRMIMGSNPSKFSACGDDCPVEKVSWNDAQKFIRSLNKKEGSNRYRLPTEAEWEYAARAGSTTQFCYGDDFGRFDEHAWAGNSSGNKSHSVAQRKPNAWGLYDMHGNVREWCQDWKSDYPDGSVTDPTGPLSGSVRVNRGGSWYDYAEFCRSADRGGSRSDSRDVNLGFRLALSPGQ